MPTYTDIKQHKEGVTRSISDISTVSNWSIFLDVVAQSGKFSTAGGGSLNFVVDSESRFWSQFFIDRFTLKYPEPLTELIPE